MSRRIGMIGIMLGVAAVVWYTTRAVENPPPPLPDSIADAEIHDALTEAREKVVRNPKSASNWGQLGLLFGAHSWPTEANQCFAEAARLAPGDFRWPYFLGTMSLVHNPADAIPHLRAARERVREPRDRSAVRLRLAEALVERLDFDEAAELVAEDLREFPDNPRAHYDAGLLAIARDDFPAAITHLEKCVEAPTARKAASIALANAYRRLGDATKSAKIEANVATLPPDALWDDDPLWEVMRREVGRRTKLTRVTQFRETRRLGEAVKVLEELALADPGDTYSRVSLGFTLAEGGKFDRAKEVLNEVLRNAPENATARFFLGVSLVAQGEDATRRGSAKEAKPLFEDALKELRRAAAIKPDLGMAHFYAGKALELLDRRGEAIDELRLAVAVRPEFVDCHLALAELLLQAGEREAAIRAVRNAERIAPNDPRRAQWLKQFGE